MSTHTYIFRLNRGESDDSPCYLYRLPAEFTGLSGERPPALTKQTRYAIALASQDAARSFAANLRKTDSSLDFSVVALTIR